MRWCMADRERRLHSVLGQLTPGRWLLLILVVSVCLRVGVALYLGDAIEEVRGGTYDQISYDALAQRVAGGHGFTFDQDWWPYARANQPTAFWSYSYTLYLTGIYWIFGHHPLVGRLLQALIAGILMPWLVYRLGRRAFGQRAGLIAAAIAAIYFYFVHYAASLMTETFYILGILWIVDAAMRLAAEVSATCPGLSSGLTPQFKLGFELGIAMAFTLLLRQVVVVFFVVLVLWLLWVGRRAARLRPILASLLVVAVVCSVLISPWIVRNYCVFGQLSLPNTNAGFTFFWSNHPIYGTRFDPVLSPEHGTSYQDLIPLELRDLNEAALDRALLARGLAFVADDPGRYLLLSLSRIPVYFLFWPTRDSTILSNAARVLSFGLFLPFMIYGLLLALKQLPKWYVRRGSSRERAGIQRAVWDAPSAPRFEYVILFLLFIGVYTAIHLASWANVRYRLPVDALLILFAAFAVDHLIDRLSDLRGKRLASV
jgi:4-amino-4-deoxy-L-arabinose transferase-like glycosyltransferase